MFTATSVDHARSIRLFISAGTMKHTCGDGFIEQRITFRIRNLSRDDIVNLGGVTNFVVLVKEDEEMHMRESTLLKFDGVNHCNGSSKYPIFDFL
jgi:hypothetical protein